MKTILRTRFSALFIAVLLTSSLSATAGDEAVRPSQFNLKAFVRASLNFIGGNSYKADALVEKLQSKQTDRVCVCEIVELQNRLSAESNRKDLGKTFKVLIEGNSKRSDQDWMGRTSQNKVIVFSKQGAGCNKGDYVKVRVTDCTKATLLGEIA